MTESIRVLWIAAPYKLQTYHSVAKYFPPKVELRVVSAVLGYDGKIPILSRFGRDNRGIWFLPRRELIRQFMEFRPDIAFTDYPAYPSWYETLLPSARESSASDCVVVGGLLDRVLCIPSWAYHSRTAYKRCLPLQLGNGDEVSGPHPNRVQLAPGKGSEETSREENIRPICGR